MRIKRPAIILENVQFKSIEKIRLLARKIDEIEQEVGIHETIITVRNPFICGDIDLNDLSTAGMEGVLRRILIKCRKLPMEK